MERSGHDTAAYVDLDEQGQRTQQRVAADQGDHESASQRAADLLDRLDGRALARADGRGDDLLLGSGDVAVAEIVIAAPARQAVRDDRPLAVRRDRAHVRRRRIAREEGEGLGNLSHCHRCAFWQRQEDEGATPLGVAATGIREGPHDMRARRFRGAQHGQRP